MHRRSAARRRRLQRLVCGVGPRDQATVREAVQHRQARAVRASQHRPPGQDLLQCYGRQGAQPPPERQRRRHQVGQRQREAAGRPVRQLRPRLHRGREGDGPGEAGAERSAGRAHGHPSALQHPQLPRRKGARPHR